MIVHTPLDILSLFMSPNKMASNLEGLKAIPSYNIQHSLKVKLSPSFTIEVYAAQTLPLFTNTLEIQVQFDTQIDFHLSLPTVQNTISEVSHGIAKSQRHKAHCRTCP